jgi:signal transduction histidine kinase/CheY-like chemotaxis protein/HAMP domain-containing protein
MLAGIQWRLLLILGLTVLALLAASATALIALMEIRAEAAAVTKRALPASGAALVLARVGERLQDRTPALMAAKGADARRRQTELLKQDLLLLGSETDRLRHLHPGGGVEDLSGLAPALADDLRDLANVLEARAAYVTALEHQRSVLMDLRDHVQQILGPSILAVAAAIDRQSTADATLFRRAATTQGPLLDAERLVGRAFSELLIAADAPTSQELGLAHDTFKRIRYRLEAIIPSVPSGLRPELRDAIGELDDQLTLSGVFALRAGELAALERADRLVTGSRRIAAALKAGVDALVLSANENIARAAAAMGDTILTNTVLFVAVSIAVVLLATLLSYRFVVRDISLNLRAVTRAMQRLAAGERDARVPAMERRDEIGDLARVFNVFKDQAFEVGALHQQLLEKSNLLVATFDNMNDGFTVCDAEGRLVAWNPQYLDLYGLSSDHIEFGTPLTRVHRMLAGGRAKVFTTLGQEVPLSTLAEGRGTLKEQLEVHFQGGRVVELRRNPIPDGGFVTIHMDVTERRAMEGQLRQAQKMEAVGQLTGGIAHDFNNILGTIVGNLTFLEPAMRNEPALRDRWKRAMAAADRAARQVERLLAFSRRQRLAPEVVDVNSLVAGMLDLLECSLGEGVALSTELAPDLPAVRVDPGQLENALMNLAINARDATKGEGRIRIETMRHGEEAAEIAVSDTGCGIPAELLDRVFEPFFTTKADGKGSGLGLSMVYGFVRQSGGEVHVDSAPGQGTTVRIRLPVTVEPAGASALAASRDDGPLPMPRGNGDSVLVVDDNQDLLAVTADQLRGLGYRVLAASDGAAALEALEREPGIRLLYTDMLMPPPWDGVGLAREAVSRRPDLAVLFTSAETLEPPDSSAQLLRKPVALDRLAHAVRRALSR